MPAAWRLATSSLSARRTRTALLCACVAMCAALVCAISCAIASINAGLEQRIAETVGAADLRIVHPGSNLFDDALIKTAEAWPGVAAVGAHLRDSLALKNPASGKDTRVLVTGIIPQREARLRPFDFESGRMMESDDEAVFDVRTAAVLGLSAGDTFDVVRFGETFHLKMVGAIRPPPLSEFIGAQQPAYFTLAALQRISEYPGKIHEIEIMLEPASKQTADAFANAHRAEVPRPLFLQTTARSTAGFQSNRATSQIALIIASVFAFIASSFIIATGMTTGVTERVRELAVLRCIGATRRQLAAAQVFSGVVVGAIGASVGLPIGIIGSAFLVHHYPQQLPGGFALSVPGVTVAALGSIAAGVIGAAWSAWSAARVSPLEGLAARARAPRSRTIVTMLIVGALLVVLHAVLVLLRIRIADRFFWFYVPIAIPAMLSGYFLLGTPVTAAIARFLSPVLSFILRLPPHLLARTLAQTPFRHGFTAASMMVGVAMLISIWTNGRSIMEHWLERIQFPDAFVTGLSIRPDTAERIRKLPGVAECCAVTRQSVGTDAFGIKGITKYKTTFFAFEPEPFFHMSRVEWLQGDPATAIPRLKAGGAVIVAKEFLVTRKIGLGAKITLIDDKDQPHDFEVVGVVTNPGLDVASRFFDIGENYLDQAVNSVFGSRDDLIKCFGNDSISLIQVNFKPGADPKTTYNSIRNLPGSGIFAGSTAVWLKDYLRTMIGGSLKIFSLVAVGAMVIASFGVANIIIAGVQARAFQFGVLRAVGAHRWLLGRLVIGEALVIALSACLLGTGLGLQAAWGGQNVTSASIGIEFGFRPPVLQVGWAWLAVVGVTLAAAAPTAFALVRRQPRELLGTVKG